MAEIALDLSGVLGLAEGFHGDKDTVTPRPERVTGQQGFTAGGFYNPYLRQGYMSPPPNTFTDLTPSTNYYKAAVHDPITGYTFYAENGTDIYRTNDSTTTTLSDTGHDVAGKIHDLEMYELNGVRHLYYTHVSDDLYSYATTTLDKVNSTLIRVPSSGTEKPIVVFSSAERASDTIFMDKTISDAQSGDILVIVCTSGLGATTTGTIGGVSMTVVDTIDDLTEGQTTGSFKTTVLVGTFASNNEVILTSSDSSAVKQWTYAVIRGGTSSIEVDHFAGLTTRPVNTLQYVSNSLYLNHIHVSRTSALIKNTTATDSQDYTGTVGAFSYGLSLKPDGTRMYLGSAGTGPSDRRVFQYNLTTGWDISTASYASKSIVISGSHFPEVKISSDGTKLITWQRFLVGSFPYVTYTLGTPFELDSVSGNTSGTFNLEGSEAMYGSYITDDGLYFYAGVYDSKYKIVQFTLGTAWDLSTATRTGEYVMPGTGSEWRADSIAISGDHTLVYVGNTGTDKILTFRFNPRYPKDVTKIEPNVVGGVQDSLTLGYNFYQIAVQETPTLDKILLLNPGSVLYERDVATSGTVVLSSINTELTEHTSTNFKAALYEVPAKRLVDIGVVLPLSSGVANDNWLTETQGQYITSLSEYNFLRPAENGFMYLFTGRRVSKIDGSTFGGSDGSFTKDVLLFPEQFTITDAVGFRGSMFIAVHRYPVDLDPASYNHYVGGCGIYIWDMRSVEFGSSQYVEIPGVRRIVKLYPSQDGMLKLLTINDEGLSELRQFGYNDAGGVVFGLVRTLGLGGSPSTPEGLTIVGDKAVWLGRNGTLYSERGGAVIKLAEPETMGATTATSRGLLDTGAVVYGGSSQTGDSGYREDKTHITFSYTDGTDTEIKRVYPFDLKGQSNSAITPGVGNVYTTVTYIPVTSKVRRVRIYNAPVSSTGSTVIATVKLYFNQSTSATMPNGMTKSITLDEAKRGYVDFNISKPYVHAIQLEIEWATGTPIGDDMYMPSAAIISTEETTVATPDGE